MPESAEQPVAPEPGDGSEGRQGRRELSRQELHDLVWSEPIRRLAPGLGVSDVALAKACRRAHIPVPERGYWARRRVGKKATRIPLPPRPPGVSDNVRVGRNLYYWDRPTDEEILGPIPPPPIFPEPIADVRARAIAMVGKVRIPNTSVQSHVVIAAALRDEERRREKERIRGYAYSWDKPLYDSPLQRRRLTILNALFLALQRCESKASPLGRQGNDVCIEIGDQRVAFTLDSPGQKHNPKRSPTADGSSREKLQLTIKTLPDSELPRSHWQDEDNKRLEDHLDEIAVELLVCAEIHCREIARGRHEWRVERKVQLEEDARQRQAEEERRERERLAALQRQRVQRLLGEATALGNAKAIREYVEEVRGEVSTSLPSISREELDDWATWALSQADAIDPIRSRAFLQPDAVSEAPTTPTPLRPSAR